MKKILNVKFVLLLAMLVAISTCGIDDEIDAIISECDATENNINPSQDRLFHMRCDVTWKDGSPATDLTVNMHINKEYCEGNTNGHYESEQWTTDHVGSWNSWYEATYTYKNKKDKVLVQFIIAKGAYDWTYDYVYRWEDVEQNNYSTWKDITLPINEDGS